jgi:hypothetical protein
MIAIQASELLGNCRHLTLAGVDDEGNLEWIGTYQQWVNAQVEKINVEYLADSIRVFNEVWS